MISLTELPYLAEVFVAKNREILGAGALAGSLALLNHLAGGGPISAKEMARIDAASSARSLSSPARAPAGTSSTSETTAQNSRTIAVNGNSYSAVASPQYPERCMTRSLTTLDIFNSRLPQDQELKAKLVAIGAKPGDPMYMKLGDGKDSRFTTWKCEKNQRIPNSPPPPVPGRTIWH